MSARQVALLIFALVTVASRADCSCGPTYCVDAPGYLAALSGKKAAASSAGYPLRLVALYDALDHCEASITTAPDGFSIYTRTSDSPAITTIDGWTAENEANDAARLKSGELKACLVIVARHAIDPPCCGQQPYNQRTDYDADLDLNTSATLTCGGAAAAATH